MSYILEALQKAEKQRELGQVPGIGSVHEASNRRRSRRWQWVLAAILILNAAVIAALFWPSQVAEIVSLPSDAAPTEPVAQQPVSPQPDRPVPTPMPEPELTTASQGKESTAQLDVDTQKLPVPVESPGIESRPIKPLPFSPEKTSAEAIPLKPLPLPKNPPQVPQPLRVETPSPAPEHQRLPIWPLVGDDLFRQVNAELKVNVHVYSKSPEKRFVFLNMNIYHEGDKLSEGPQLEQITQDGVILSFRGERFRVPAR